MVINDTIAEIFIFVGTIKVWVYVQWLGLRFHLVYRHDSRVVWTSCVCLDILRLLYTPSWNTHKEGGRVKDKLNHNLLVIILSTSNQYSKPVLYWHCPKQINWHYNLFRLCSDSKQAIGSSPQHIKRIYQAINVKGYSRFSPHNCFEKISSYAVYAKILCHMR